MIFRTGERRRQWWCYGSGGDYFDHSNPFLESMADIKGVRRRANKRWVLEALKKTLSRIPGEGGVGS